jgi:hypothetical protein
MRWLVAILWALGAPALAQDFDQSVRELFGDDPERYRAVIEGFQAAVRDGDGATAAGFVEYPIEVEVAGDKRIVRDAADFAAHFAEIVTPEIAAAVEDQPLAEMMVNYQGVMLGQGEVWVSGICRDPACETSEVKVVAIQPVAEDAAPGVGEVKAFHDWLAGCDNRLGCTAIGLPAEGGSGGYVVLRLEAGAAAEPSVGFVLVDPEGTGTTMRVEVKGKDGLGPIALPAEADGAWVRALAPEGERAALIAAMRDGERLELALGEAAPVAVSLRGATASMLLIDDLQWRIGTVTALARPGDAPAASVASPPDAPTVQARPMRELDPVPALPEGVAAADDPGCERVEAMAFDLGDGATLWGACDFAGPYNTAYRFWVAGPDGLGPARFAVPGRGGDDAAVLTEPGLAADGLGIEATHLGRGLGDCGEASRWAWTGAGFALVRLAGLDTCAGVAPDDWPMLWRSE